MRIQKDIVLFIPQYATYIPVVDLYMVLPPNFEQCYVYIHEPFWLVGQRNFIFAERRCGSGQIGCKKEKLWARSNPFYFVNLNPKYCSRKIHLISFSGLPFSAMSDWYTLMGNEVKCGPAIQAQKPFQLKAGAYQLK